MRKKKSFVTAVLLIAVTCIGWVAAVSNKKAAAVSVPEITLPEKTIEATPEIALAKPEARPEEKGCVFKTVFEEETTDSDFHYKTPAKMKASSDEALAWISKAQLNNGGWGAGSHARQEIKNPHAVHADPATTAMVAMAMLRCGNTLSAGEYSSSLSKATDYLLLQVENSSAQSLNITTETGTQPQIKLGQNIDVVLTSQYLTNLLAHLNNNSTFNTRVRKCLDICVSKIQRGQNENGSSKGAGWAGVLQSSFANNALETAKANGAKVDDKALEKSRDYQKDNYDSKNKTARTDEAAGVMLYAISGSARASAKEARVAKEKIAEAKREGKIAKNAPVSVETLQNAGMSNADAMRYGTAYEINQAAKQQAQSEEVMSGFGSNGGEEFLSYLQTGEGLIMSKDIEWKKWYDNVSGKLIRIQNDDGSWNGHHCITSPVFCTATSLLILSVNNDVESLMSMGK